MRLPPTVNILGAVVGAVVNELAGSSDTAAIEPDRPTSQQVQNYAIIGCTDDEIADRYLVPVEWIRSMYVDELRRGRAIHRIGIRQAQWNAIVKKGTATLLVWLGRNMLRQSSDPPKQLRALPSDQNAQAEQTDEAIDEGAGEDQVADDEVPGDTAGDDNGRARE